MTIRVTKAFALFEIEAEQIQVTKSFVLVELGAGEIYVSKAFLLVEISNAEINVTKAFTLLELGLQFPTKVPTIGNFGCIFDGVNVTEHVISASLIADTKITDTKVFTDEGLTITNGTTDWHAELKGHWMPELDDVFGEAVSSDQNKVTFEFRIGSTLTGVTYKWINEAFASNYKIDTNSEGAIVYSVKIALSGPPSRIVRS